MNIDEILDVIDELLDRSWSLPLSGGRCVVDADLPERTDPKKSPGTVSKRSRGPPLFTYYFPVALRNACRVALISVRRCT